MTDSNSTRVDGPASAELSPQYLALIEKFGEPFAKALAVFVNATADGMRDDAMKAMTDQLRSSDLDSKLRTYSANTAAAHRDLASLGRLQQAEFVPNGKLRSLLRAKGISQKQLAHQLEMDPASVSRIVNSPERCRASTLRRVAQILQVEVGDII